MIRIKGSQAFEAILLEAGASRGQEKRWPRLLLAPSVADLSALFVVRNHIDFIAFWISATVIVFLWVAMDHEWPKGSVTMP